MIQKKFPLFEVVLGTMEFNGEIDEKALKEWVVNHFNRTSHYHLAMSVANLKFQRFFSSLICMTKEFLGEFCSKRYFYYTQQVYSFKDILIIWIGFFCSTGVINLIAFSCLKSWSSMTFPRAKLAELGICEL